MAEIMKTDFFTSLNEILQSGNSVLLSTIISQHGSSPRGTGARMAVTSNRRQIGTIGGGRLEEGLHEKYPQFMEGQNSIVLDFVLSEAEAANLEMICGGSISLLVDPISSENKALIRMYEKINQTVIEQKNGWLFSYLPDKSKQDRPLKCFVSSDQQIIGSWTPDVVFNNAVPEEITFDGNVINLSEIDLKTPQILKSGETRIFLEPIGQHSTVLIVGAGHIAQKLAPLTTMVGFQTVVLDDREDFISELRFPTIDKRILLENFDNVFKEMNIDEQTFIVIVTRGHQFDKSVLQQALKTSAAYVGMIGSRRKIKLTFEALLEDGVSEEELSKVHSPIGLNIGAETPEEIAISIVAELIQERSQLNI
jgi:xanthine dehydrogenase accessory factor